MIEHEHDRRRCRLFIFLVETVFGQNDVDARLFDRVNLFDRPSQLALKCLEIIDFVLKFGHTELAVVENLKAFRAARQAHRCQLKTFIVHIARQHEDRRAGFCFFDRILSAGFLQRVDDIARVFCFQIGVQRNHLGLAAVPKADTEEQNQECRGRPDDDVTLPALIPVPQLPISSYPFRHDLIPLTIFLRWTIPDARLPRILLI